ncbi:OmpA family protein [Myxococcota bacterium]|nr:OmpA family protein [Myxococcota bacterium]MBU1381601.1 OmpA family protein [Myxococcota bacterium]MBU1496855.1 OmpA family protein [Myxococcota bacterium]
MSKLTVFLIVISISFTNFAYAQKTAKNPATGPAGPVGSFGDAAKAEPTPPAPAPVNAEKPDVSPAAPVIPESKTSVPTPEKSLYPIPGVNAGLYYGSGLFYTMDAIPRTPWTFLLSLHTEFFRYSDFIVANRGEVNTRFAGAISASLFLPKGFEIFANLYSTSNLNERDPETVSAEPKMQMALGDLTLGGKYSREILPYLNAGGAIFAKFYSGVGEVSPDLGATAAGFFLTSTFKAAALRPSNPLPFMVHVNIGYIYDNSKSLMENVPLSSENTSLQPFYQYLIRSFALGVSSSRVAGSIGFEYPFKAGKMVVTPMLEWAFRYYTDSADKDILDWQSRVSTSGDASPDSAFSHNLMIGAKVDLNNNFSLAAGVDITLSYPGFAISPTLPVYNIFTQVSYRSTTCADSIKIVEKTKEIVKYIDKPVEKKLGSIAGKIVDAKGMPVPGAIISYVGTTNSDQAADETGSFKSYPMAQGTHTIGISRRGYIAKEEKVVIKDQSVHNVTFRIEKKVDPVCSVRFNIKDSKGKILESEIKIEGKTLENKPVLIDQMSEKAGATTVKFRPGAYSVTVIKKGYLSKVHSMVMTKCEENVIEIELKNKPRTSSVKINKKSKIITISKRIHFEYNSARLKANASVILDEVASVLIENPDILLVRIEGHTDNKGNAAYNLKLSQDRADAVRSYLVKQGVKADRLEAKGYGRTKPRYANISERLRQRNRRVEFKILKHK